MQGRRNRAATNGLSYRQLVIKPPMGVHHSLQEATNKPVGAGGHQ
jgi:hypothetical protein